MKIAFALAVHKPYDDRLWFEQAQALLEQKHEVFMLSGRIDKGDLCFNNHNMPFRQQINEFYCRLNKVNPDIVICDHPLTILSAVRYKQKTKNRHIKIYYDITEYYPSKIHFHHSSKVINLLKFPFLCGISFYVSCFVDGFIFGEHYKALPYRVLCFWKRSINLSYYADLKHIKNFPVHEIKKKFVLFFAGKLTQDAGFDSFINAAVECAKQFPNTNFVCRIVSRDIEKEYVGINGKNLTTEFFPTFPFVDFCEKFGDADIFSDLRKIDFENSHSLPIKLFYYMAAGRPVIYSNLKAIRKGVPEIDSFGNLVNPKKTYEITEKIAQYIENQSLYVQHCDRARELAKNKYNWDKIKNIFVNFIETVNRKS
ncbi:MAG: hypothetical protein LBV75_09570 [Paludibacter sp.]|jgi:glycosyltransferase involved in cell wall biosynthesis|nr:hypothetical protein [Paludibacter sp.]